MPGQTPPPDTLGCLMDSIPALVARVDCNMVIHYANKPFLKWFSTNNSFPSNSFPATVGKDVFHQIQKHLDKILMGKPANFSISFYRDGAYQYMDVNLAPEFDPIHQVTGFIFHSTDVTGKLSEDRARHDYFENATIGLHWVNAEGTIIWANRAEMSMLGYDEHEYIGQHISKFHKNKTCIRDILTRLSNKEILQSCEAELLCKDGSTRYVTINSSVLWEGDRFVHTRCFTIDITAQKLAAQAAKDSEERFKVIANLVPLVIWTSNENGLCTFLNVRWKELTGKSIEQGLGKQWLSVVHPEDRNNIEASWDRSFSERKVFEAKFRIQNAEGGYTVSYANLLPRFVSNNSFVGYAGIIQDVTAQEQIKLSLEKMVLHRTDDLRRKNIELKEAERSLLAKNEELEKINIELTSFAHVASHDLQEPLRKIQTFTDRLIHTDGDKLSSKGQEFLQRIVASSARMRRLINDILFYSQTNDVTVSREPTDLNQLLKEVVDEFEVKIEETKAVIENKGLPSLPVVRFQFHQVFLNLVGNALKFAKAGRTPRLTVESLVIKGDQVPGIHETGDFYHITIADNGIGFDSQYADQIFGIFKRLHSKSDFEGTGIGLAICKKIVENHGGKMTAEGRPDEGATFHVYLPANDYKKNNNKL